MDVAKEDAVEVFLDGVGNDNGYCEAGERCVYTPNLGRAQGRGVPTEAPAQTIGGVANVTLISYPAY